MCCSPLPYTQWQNGGQDMDPARALRKTRRCPAVWRSRCVNSTECWVAVRHRRHGGVALHVRASLRSPQHQPRRAHIRCALHENAGQRPCRSGCRQGTWGDTQQVSAHQRHAATALRAKPVSQQLACRSGRAAPRERLAKEEPPAWIKSHGTRTQLGAGAPAQGQVRHD